MKPEAFVVAWADPVTDPEGAERFRQAPPPTHKVICGTIEYQVYVPPELTDDMVAAARAVRAYMATWGMSVLRLDDGQRRFVPAADI